MREEIGKEEEFSEEELDWNLIEFLFSIVCWIIFSQLDGNKIFSSSFFLYCQIIPNERFSGRDENSNADKIVGNVSGSRYEIMEINIRNFEAGDFWVNGEENEKFNGGEEESAVEEEFEFELVDGGGGSGGNGNSSGGRNEVEIGGSGIMRKWNQKKYNNRIK